MPHLAMSPAPTNTSSGAASGIAAVGELLALTPGAEGVGDAGLTGLLPPHPANRAEDSRAEEDEADYKVP